MTPLPAEQEGGPTLLQSLSQGRLPVEYVPVLAIALVAVWILLVGYFDRRSR